MVALSNGEVVEGLSLSLPFRKLVLGRALDAAEDLPAIAHGLFENSVRSLTHRPHASTMPPTPPSRTHTLRAVAPACGWRCGRAGTERRAEDAAGGTDRSREAS